MQHMYNKYIVHDEKVKTNLQQKNYLFLSPDFEEAAVSDSNLSSKIHLSCYYITILYRLNSEEFL